MLGDGAIEDVECGHAVERIQEPPPVAVRVVDRRRRCRAARAARGGSRGPGPGRSHRTARMPWWRTGVGPTIGGGMPTGTPLASVSTAAGAVWAPAGVIPTSNVSATTSATSTRPVELTEGVRGRALWGMSERYGLCTLVQGGRFRRPGPWAPRARSRREMRRGRPRGRPRAGTAARGASAGGTRLAASTPSTMSAITSPNGRLPEPDRHDRTRGIAADGAGGTGHPRRGPERRHAEAGLVGGGAEAARGVGEAQGGELGDGPVVHGHQHRRGV